jgi:hypothetical protein
LKKPAGVQVPLSYSGGSGLGYVLFKASGNCTIGYTDYSVFGGPYLYGTLGTCDVTATNDAVSGYPSSTSLPIKFEFYKIDPKPLLLENFTISGYSTRALPSEFFGINKSITISTTGGGAILGGAQSHSGTISYSVTGKSCVTRTYLTGSGRETAFTATEPTTCVVTATKSASTGYNETSSPPVSFVFVEFTPEPFVVLGAQQVGTGGIGSIGYVNTSGGPPGGLATFSVTGANCSLNGYQLIATSPTTCVVTAAKSSSVGYKAVTSAPINVTFNVLDQDPLLLKPLNAEYQTNVSPISIPLSTTGGSGQGVVSYSTQGANCSISGSNLIANVPATCVITAKKASSTFFNAATSAPVTTNTKFVVYDQSPLVIRYDPMANYDFTTKFQWGIPTSTQINLSTTGGSGNGEVTFSVTGANCSLNKTVLTTTPFTTNSNTCVVNAAKAASNGYNATTAAPLSLVFGIFDQAPLVFLPGWDNSYHEGSIAIPLSTTGGTGSGVVTYSVTGACYVEQGKLKGQASPGIPATCTVTATKAGKAGYYASVSSAPVTLYLTNHINQSSLTIVETPVASGSSSLTLETIGGSGTGNISFTVISGGCSIAGATLSSSTSTSCVVLAKKSGSQIYNETFSQRVTFVFKLP